MFCSCNFAPNTEAPKFIKVIVVQLKSHIVFHTGETLKEVFNILNREIQIKMALRFHITPIRMTKISKTNDGLW